MSIKRTRRSVLAGMAISPLVATAAHAFGALRVAGGGSIGALTTLTLTNTTGSPISAGAPIKPFALQFPKGVIPTGTLPQLQFASDNSNWPCTFRLMRTWSDGSLKHCGAVPSCCPKAFTANGTVTVNVMNGGSGSQTASGFSNATFNSALLQANVTGRGINLTGTYNALVNTADVANTFKAVTYGDGPGGLSKRFDTNFVKAGSAHGTLLCRHYVDAVKDTGGTLAGFWWLARTWQPYYDTGATKNPLEFSAYTVQSAGAGGVGTSTFTPPFSSVYSANTFTWSSGNTFTFGGAHNWWHGAGASQGDFINVIPVVLTGASLPTGLTANTLYYAKVTSGSTTFTLWTDSIGLFFAANASAAGSGGTITPTQVCLYYGSQFSATSAAEWQWVQAQGSVATPAQNSTGQWAIQVKIDTVYRKKTRCFPPYDLTKTAGSCATSQNGYTFSWDTITIGPLVRSLGATGDYDDIGILPAWNARHFYNQAPVDELYARILGLAEAHWSIMRSTSNLMPPVLNANTYAGMPASDTTGPNQTAPVTPNTNQTLQINTDISNGGCEDHRANTTIYPYLVFGSPEFMDLMTEQGLTALYFNMAPSNRNFVSGSAIDSMSELSPINATAVIALMGIDGMRTCAWALRDLIGFGTLLPDTDPDGTGLTQYGKDILAANFQAIADWFAQQNAYTKSVGFFSPPSNSVAHGTWMYHYHVLASCWAAALSEDTNGLAKVANDAKWYDHATGVWSPWHFYAYDTITETEGVYWNVPTAPSPSDLPDDAHWASLSSGFIGLSWAGGVFTWNTLTGFTNVAGNKVIFPRIDRNRNPVTPPGGLSNNTPYYAVNISGSTFQLSATPGGTAISVTGSGSVGPGDPGTLCMTVVSPGATDVPSGGTGDGSYIAEAWGMWGWLIALNGSTTNLVNARSDAQGRFSAAGVGFSNPKWCIDSTYG